jgi:uncharacterized membrane-anchored protein
MKRLILTSGLLLAGLFCAFAQEQDDAKFEMEMRRIIDSISNSYQYQTGQVNLKDGLATLQIPAGFRYLDPAQSRQVLEDLWGNPPGNPTLGMIFPENLGPLDSASFAFNITYDEMGYVKDADADEIDYNKLLKDIKSESVEENKAREKEGYEPINIIGWASQPFYDKDKKILHWAKEFQVGESPENTLNYEVRVLGRRGVLSMNAIGMMSQLNAVKGAIPGITSAVAYTEGNRYSDFSESSGDKIAAWTIGGLVAGKILAKAGFFAILLKFGKFIILGLLAAGTAVYNWLRGRRQQEESEMAYEEMAPEPPASMDPPAVTETPDPAETPDTPDNTTNPDNPTKEG